MTGPLAALLLLAPDPAALEAWDTLEKGVLWGRIAADEALERVPTVLGDLARAWPLKAERRWTFPIEGGRKRWVGGRNGEGFRPKRYRWTEGNKHRGHPAHDVFIPRDRDEDCRDDETSKPRYAVAMQRAVVVSVNHEFEPGKPRGGKYVWMYAPSLDLLLYYSHLETISVQPGEVVEPGKRLGIVGKTGFSKSKAHKPCHIHLMVLKGKRMKPVDWFRFRFR